MSVKKRKKVKKIWMPRLRSIRKDVYEKKTQNMLDFSIKNAKRTHAAVYKQNIRLISKRRVKLLKVSRNWARPLKFLQENRENIYG